MDIPSLKHLVLLGMVMIRMGKIEKVSEILESLPITRKQREQIARAIVKKCKREKRFLDATRLLKFLPEEKRVKELREIAKQCVEMGALETALAMAKLLPPPFSLERKQLIHQSLKKCWEMGWQIDAIVILQEINQFLPATEFLEIVEQFCMEIIEQWGEVEIVLDIINCLPLSSEKKKLEEKVFKKCIREGLMCGERLVKRPLTKEELEEIVAACVRKGWWETAKEGVKRLNRDLSDEELKRIAEKKLEHNQLKTAIEVVENMKKTPEILVERILEKSVERGEMETAKRASEILKRKLSAEELERMCRECIKEGRINTALSIVSELPTSSRVKILLCILEQYLEGGLFKEAERVVELLPPNIVGRDICLEILREINSQT